MCPIRALKLFNITGSAPYECLILYGAAARFRMISKHTYVPGVGEWGIVGDFLFKARLRADFVGLDSLEDYVGP